MISLRGPKLKIFAAVLAVICLAAGIYFTFFQSQGFEKTTAEIVDIAPNYDGDSTTYTPTVRYTVNGVIYTETLDQSSGSYKVGKTITIKYNPKDPSIIHGSGGFGIYLMVVSAAILAVVIVSTVREKQAMTELHGKREMGARRGYRPSEPGEERELYFLTDLGTPKYGHRLEDGQRRVLYEAKMTKFTLITPFGFDFIDHEHGTTTPHLVGHSEESHWNSLLLDSHYTFELDGVDVFKHLQENGITVESSLGGGSGKLLGANYRIFRDGTEIARAESTGQYPHEEDMENHKVASALGGQGFYRVWTTERNLDLLFMTLMAFARTGAMDAKGGTFGAIAGTIRKNLRDE